MAAGRGQGAEAQSQGALALSPPGSWGHTGRRRLRGLEEQQGWEASEPTVTPAGGTHAPGKGPVGESREGTRDTGPRQGAWGVGSLVQGLAAGLASPSLSFPICKPRRPQLFPGLGQRGMGRREPSAGWKHGQERARPGHSRRPGLAWEPLPWGRPWTPTTPAADTTPLPVRRLRAGFCGGSTPRTVRRWGQTDVPPPARLARPICSLYGNLNIHFLGLSLTSLCRA